MIEEIRIKQLMNIPLTYGDHRELFIHEKMIPLRKYDQLGILDANQVSFYGWLYDSYGNEA